MISPRASAQQNNIIRDSKDLTFKVSSIMRAAEYISAGKFAAERLQISDAKRLLQPYNLLSSAGRASGDDIGATGHLDPFIVFAARI